MAKHEFKDYEALIHQQAMRGYKRLIGFGVSVDYEDVVQQMSLTFCIASDKFDPERGFSFTTYLHRALWIQFNKWAENQVAYRMLVTNSDVETESGERLSLYDVTVDEAMSPEDVVTTRLTNEKRFERLSPIAKTIVTELVSPSAEMDEGWKAKKAQIEHGRSMGLSTQRLPEDINFAFMFDHLNVPPRKRGDIKRELSNAFGVKLL
jgi:DNA-directed RNA polymerase specialized sigma24 family protein